MSNLELNIEIDSKKKNSSKMYCYKMVQEPNDIQHLYGIKDAHNVRRFIWGVKPILNPKPITHFLEDYSWACAYDDNETYLEKTFIELVNNWKRETIAISATDEIIMNHNYQNIIGLGPEAIPLILKKLEKETDHWFWALKSISREDPVPPEDRGRMKKMAKHWLDWGRQKGYI